MSTGGRRFVIAGAGISGLTLALALAKFGASVTVIERKDRIEEAGAGLQISPNAHRILDRLGASRYLMPRIHIPNAIDVFPFGWRGPLVSLELGAVMQARFGAPYGVMHRADLANGLHQACKRFATIDILFGVKRVDFAYHSRGFSVMIEEADCRSRTVRPFAYVGADGVHSATRTELIGGPPARYSGFAAWRMLLPFDRIPDNLNGANINLLWGTGFHVVVYPLPHRGVVSVALLMHMSEKRARQARDINSFRAPRDLKYSKTLKAIFAAATELTPWPIYGVSTRKWHEGAVGLVGDAAHAMVPFGAQGAAMAIEDAAVLAPLLITSDDPQSAYSDFASFRQKRVARVARFSAGNGRIFNMPWVVDYLRDLVVWRQGPRAHLKRLDWIYSYDPATASEPERPGSAARS